MKIGLVCSDSDSLEVYVKELPNIVIYGDRCFELICSTAETEKPLFREVSHLVLVGKPGFNNTDWLDPPSILIEPA